MVARFFGKDPLNKKGSRKFDGANRNDYNCGGYALETFNWYIPCKNNREQSANYGWGVHFSYEERIELAVKRILKDFRGLIRVIEDVSELQVGEYAIALRLSSDDFHFVKRNAKGLWHHKRGGRTKIETMTKEQLFDTEWDGGYDSRIVLFAKKRV